MQTQVATNMIVSAGGIKITTTATALAPEVWVIGLITKYDPESACPYEIKWDTQPLPILHRKSADEVAKLVANFKHCTTLRLLRGYVGLDLLWLREPAVGIQGEHCLKYGMVRPFDPVMNKYKITFRSGIWTWRSEEEVQDAKLFTESVTTCQHPTWTFAAAQEAAEELATFSIPESQQLDENETASASLNVVRLRGRGKNDNPPVLHRLAP